MSLVRMVRLRVPAAAAKPGPSIGQALGPLGINMPEFCKQFNERTEPLYERDTPLSVSLSAMSDRSFKFVVKSPPTSYLLKKAAGLTQGAVASNPSKPMAFVSPEIIFEIAKVKQQDDQLWHLPLESIARSVIGTAKSIGIGVKEVVE